MHASMSQVHKVWLWRSRNDFTAQLKGSHATWS